METKCKKYKGITNNKEGNDEYSNKRNPSRTVLGKERVRDILLLQILLTEYEIE